ncbi:MAG: flavocytochrome c [Syntrophales bacterium]|jgi:fumarate reductase flavoprotein subunit|nr:flavocytochrome c [Syntrophales bacterium]
MMREEIKEKPEVEGVSRRSVLKGAVTLGALAAGGGIALNMSMPGTAEAAAKKLPPKWEEEVDVLIIGSGFAGLAAAEASSRGRKVLILEKMPIYGGNSIINGGEYASSDDKYHIRQKLNLGEDSTKQHFDDTMKGGDYYNNPALVKIMVEDAPATLNWMMDQGGLKMREIASRAGGHTAYRARTCVAGVGRCFTEALKKMAEQSGVKIRLETAVTWVWRKDWEGPVLGVEAVTGKRTKNIKIKHALVFASGGFGQDIKMRQDFNPSITPSVNCTNHKGATGETIRYAQAIGADALQLAFIQLYPFAEPETGILDTSAVFPFRGPGIGIVYVARTGKRYVSELDRRDVCSRAAIATDSKPTYSIFNEKMTPLLGSAEELKKGLENGRFIKAETLKDLAGKIDIPADVFAETIRKHNQYLADGKDPDFNKPITAKMLPIVDGPFYALPQWPAVHHCMGGLRINEMAQVVDVWRKPIPRFYAAGEVAGGVHGSNRLGSNATPDAIVFGRIAGTNAAKEKPMA